jgi:hypothetical protein
VAVKLGAKGIEQIIEIKLTAKRRPGWIRVRRR